MTNNYKNFSPPCIRHAGWLRLLLLYFTFGMLTIGAEAQTTVTITCTGSAGSFNSGSVNSTGTKNDGNMVTINSSANRGWAHYDLTSIPLGATVTGVTANFTTFTSTSSTATNNLFGFTGDPATIAGATLYTNCGSGTSFNATSWTANALQTKAFNAAGIAFIQANIGTNNANIGYVRGSTNTYNIYGYNGVTPPNLVITYNLPLPNDLLLQLPATPTGSICNGSSTTVSVTLKNNGTSAVDFSINPATINASVTGANGTTFTPVTINSGTLAPNATQVVNIAVGYNAVASGTYNFSASVVWAPDGNTANNSQAWSANSSFNLTASSNVYTFCDGTSPQLNTTSNVGYVAQSIPHAPITPPGSPSAGPTGDDAQAAATIPFAFTFNGVAYTNLNIFTNGYIQFGTSSNNTTTYGASIPTAATPNNIAALAWEDLNVTPGTITYWTDGVAPNRKFVISWNSVFFYSASGNVTGQIVLNENDNSIDMFLTNIVQAGNFSVCGVENAAGTAGVVAPGRQFATWGTGTVTNEGWKFFVPTLSYAWSPATGLSNSAIANPIATLTAGTSQTYTVNVTDPSSGCVVSDTVLLNNLGAGDAAPTTTGDAKCAGDSAFLSAAGTSTLNWYTAAIGGTLVHTGANWDSIWTSTTTYYVESFNGICPSARTPVTVTVTPQPTINATATPSVLCLGETSQLAANHYISGNLLTTTVAGNGASANIFNISNVNGSSPIVIDSFSMGITAGTLAEVWYQPGSYTCGVTPSSSAGWTLAGQVAITPAGASPNLTIIPLYVNVTIPVGQTYAFVVACNGSNYYTNGTTECGPFVNDANIAISQGRGGAAFGGAFTGLVNTPRNFNGRVYYSFGDPNLVFDWQPSASLDNNAIPTPVATPTSTTTYVLTATNLAGCETVDSATVIVNPLPIDAVIDSVTNVFCGCGQAVLHATIGTVGSEIRWFDSAVGGTQIGTGTPFTTPYACGVQTYYAETYDPITGCIQSGPRASFTITPVTPPSMSVAATDLILCDGEPASTITVTTSNVDYVFTWSPAAGLDVTTGPVVNALPASTTTYTVSALDTVTGCINDANITIGVGSTPTIAGATASPSAMCVGSSSQLTVLAYAGGSLPAAPATYPANGGTSTIDEDIDGVVFGSLSNIQAPALCALYTDYTSLTAPVFTAGQSVPFSVYIGDCENTGFFSSGTSIFIDYNRDGDFDDAGERVYTTSITTNGPHTLSGNVVISPSASHGYTRMRIINAEGITSPVFNQTYTYGETEDYIIGIQGGASGFNFSWSPAGSLSNANIQSPVATPGTSTNYTVTVSDAAGCSASTSVPVTIVNPPAAPVVTNDTVCGQGNANLLASGSGGTLIWMDTIAGPIINTGGTYSPYVSTSQTYYVVEDQGGANVNVGLSATASGTTAFASATANYQTFDVLNPAGLIIRTVDIVPNAATPLGTAVAIQLEDAAGNALGAPVSTVTTTQGAVQTITLDMFVPQGTAYRLRPVSNPNLQYHQNGFANPYTLPGQLSITGWGAPNATTLYVFFYNWTVTVFDGVGSGCYSSPSIVSAVVNPAPALDITPGSTPSYCNTGSVVLNATGDPSWINFNWSPATGLSGTTGNTVTASPSSTTTYILTADDGVSGGCIDTASITVTVNSGPTVTIDPAPFDSLCNGSSFAINATAGSSSFKSIGTGSNSANNSIAVYDGNNSNVKTQILYTAAELNAAGLIGPGNITSIAFNVVNKLSTGSLSGFSISMANTATVAPLTTAYVAGTFTTVFSGSVTTSLGWNQHNFTTPFLWDGVSNVLVEICNGVPSVPGFDQIQNTPTASAMTIQANLLGCASTTGNPILNRPNTRFTGGAVTYSWSPAGELSASNIEDPTYTAATTGAKSLTLTVTDPSNGCIATANLDFVISDVPKVASIAAISSTDVCVSATVSMRAFGTNASYQWQISSDNINFTDLAGETNDTLSALVSTDTYFRVKSVCVDSSFSSSLLFDVSNPVLISVENDSVCGQGIVNLVSNPGAGFFSVWYDAATDGNFIQIGDTLTQYLTATDTFYVAASVTAAPSGLGAPTTYATSSATSAADDEIFNVTFGSINNSSTCATTGGGTSVLNMYSDYTGSVSPAVVQPGAVVPFSVTVAYCSGFAYGMVFTFYIDYNRDGDFDDAGETAYSNPNTTAAVTGTAYAGSITIPVTASLGKTRMRVVLTEGGATTPTGTYTWGETEDYIIQIGDDACQTPRQMVIGVVNAAPVLDVTPAAASICENGSVNLDVTTGLSDYTTFDWTPATGLNTTSGANVIASPLANTTYIVTASGNINGCIATDTAVITVNANPVIAVSTTTPNLCGGDTAQLVVDVISPVAGNYNVSSITYAPYAGALTQSAAALGDEGNQTVTLPFTFNFAGNNYTDVTIHANGQILMGAGNTSADFQYSPPTIFTAAAPNDWIGFWSDLNVALAGSITYDVVGVAPNRKLVVRFDNVDYYFATPSISYQIELNETSNAVDIFLTNIPNTSLNTRAVGMETATQGFVAPGRNTGTWTATNEAWRFAPEAAPTINWSGANIIGSTSADTIYATPTVSGYYAVTVTNSQTGCFYTDSVQINFALTPKPVIADNDTSLCSPNFIYVNVVDTGIYSGGYPTGTTFEWLSVGGQIVPPTPDLDSIPSTFGSTYFAIVTLGNGCSAMSDTATILTKAVAIVDTITNATCTGGGSILATVTSGIAPFQYVWSTDLAQTNIIQTTNTSSTQDLLSGLAAGTYYLSVSDEFGNPGSCNSGVIAYTVGGSSPIVATATGTDISCNGFGDGSATVSWTGGTAPFSILWSDGDVNATRAVLSATTLTVIVSDLSGCADTASVTINEPAAISLSLSSTNESAPGASDGTATVVISGGTPGYTVEWFDGLFAPVTTGNPATGLTADTYTCLVTDTNGCQGFDIVTVSTNTNATLNLTMLIEGMYDGAGGLVPALLVSGVGVSSTECDTILVEIRDQVSPTTVLASGTAVLGTNGQASFTFPAAINGATGYIAVFHRNAVQTWSDLVTFSATTNYNFTTAAAQAFSGNQREVVPGVWAFYSGDLAPQDEFIDILDQSVIDNDIFNFAGGYVVSDLNGDGFVDIVDQSIVDNNIFNFIGSIHP